MEKVTIKLLSREPHMSQILTGFSLLARERKWELCIEDHSQDESEPHRSVMAIVSWRGKTLIYDTLDGYQHEEAIRYHLEHCDYYFKRSFSAEKNQLLGLNWQGKMFPLGFNYHVSCRNHPMDKPSWKEEIKRLLGMDCNLFSSTYYTPGRFEETPKPCRIPQVLFLTRLWDESADLPPHLLEERGYINAMRIEIIRQLRMMEGRIHFIGGLPDTDLAQNMAPDLIMPPELTDRRNYLKCLHKSDICIGSMGLHESIGWKTGEYVAAAKGIINERFHYSVPGEFIPGENYLEFDTAEECIRGVELLVGNSEELFAMKLRNQEYYQKYLRPDVLIGNTLDLVHK